MEQEADRMSGFERGLARFIKDHQLPDAYADQAKTYFLPLIDWLLARMGNASRSAFVAGIYGAQGSGKSTLADFLCRYLTHAAGKSVVQISIDDFYLTRKERAQLAAGISPLLATRGPPGTHDTDLALETVRQATTLADGESMVIPRFDKATDDRVPVSNYSRVSGPVDLVILEGWCLGCRRVAPELLVEPLNDLERNEDKNGSWRQFVNASMDAYKPLFDLLDAMIMLKTADLDSVLRWRSEQEEKLRMSEHAAGDKIMTSPEIRRFIQFFERVSRNTEARVERIADVVLAQDEDHGIRAVEYR
jgi:D-glycerate 3-kinase